MRGGGIVEYRQVVELLRQLGIMWRVMRWDRAARRALKRGDAYAASVAMDEARRIGEKL